MTRNCLNVMRKIASMCKEADPGNSGNSGVGYWNLKYHPYSGEYLPDVSQQALFSLPYFSTLYQNFTGTAPSSDFNDAYVYREGRKYALPIADNLGYTGNRLHTPAITNRDLSKLRTEQAQNALNLYYNGERPTPEQEKRDFNYLINRGVEHQSDHNRDALKYNIRSRFSTPEGTKDPQWLKNQGDLMVNNNRLGASRVG